MSLGDIIVPPVEREAVGAARSWEKEVRQQNESEDSKRVRDEDWRDQSEVRGMQQEG
jgi:hypothetical protein